MNAKSLWITVGVPGSGKSTYLRACKDPVVSRDEIRFSLLKDDENYFAHEKEVFNLFVETIQKELDTHDTVYVDATHLNEMSRNKLLDALVLEKVEINYLVFIVPLEICLYRNSLRSGRAQVPEDVIRNMYDSMTTPTFDKKYKPNKIVYVKD